MVKSVKEFQPIKEKQPQVFHLRFHHFFHFSGLVKTFEEQGSVTKATEDYFKRTTEYLLSGHEEAEKLVPLLKLIQELVQKNQILKQEFETVLSYILIATRNSLFNNRRRQDWQDWESDVLLIKSGEFDPKNAKDSNFKEFFEFVTSKNSQILEIFTISLTTLISEYYLFNKHCVPQKTFRINSSPFERIRQYLFWSMVSIEEFVNYIATVEKKALDAISYNEDLFGKNPTKNKLGIARFERKSRIAGEEFLNLYLNSSNGMVILSHEADKLCTACAVGSSSVGEHCMVSTKDNDFNKDVCYKQALVQAIREHQTLLTAQALSRIRVVVVNNRVTKIFIPVSVFSPQNQGFVDKVIQLAQEIYLSNIK